MSRELDLVEGETALSAPVTQNSGSGERAPVVLWVVWSVELIAGVSLQTLQAVPGHVLDGQQRAVGVEQHVYNDVSESDRNEIGPDLPRFPEPMMVLFVYSMTRCRTPFWAGPTDVSLAERLLFAPPKTLRRVHCCQFVGGALIAACTSLRLK